MERGDSAILGFTVPPLAPGYARSYLLRSHGWYRVHSDTTAAPDLALLGTLERTRLGISRAATAELARAVEAAGQ